MNSFTGSRLESIIFPDPVLEAFSAVIKATSRNSHYMTSPSEKVEAMADEALLRSAESSNRMEGVTVHPHRFGPVLTGKEAPSGHAEQQLVNYREASRWLHEARGAMRPTPRDLQSLHSRLRLGFKGASEWRSQEAEREIAELCEDYKAFRGTDDFTRRFTAAAAFALDFENLRPFHDDVPRSRLTRLLVVLGLYKCGLQVQRFVSLERLMESTRVDYAAALKASSRGWSQGRHDVCPWAGYLASIVQWAYREFETGAHGFLRREAPDILVLPAVGAPAEEEKPAPRRSGRPAERREDKGPQVLAAIDKLPKRFTFEDVRQACPTVRDRTIQTVLAELRDAGKIRLIGKGRNALWEKTEEWSV